MIDRHDARELDALPRPLDIVTFSDTCAPCVMTVFSRTPTGGGGATAGGLAVAGFAVAGRF